MHRIMKILLALTIALLVAGAPAYAQRSSSRSSVNANVNRNVNANVNQNVNVNRNTNVNINNDIDVDVDVDHHYGYGSGCCYHPVARTTAVVATAAVIGSMVYSLPPACSAVVVNGIAYQQCGSSWYQPQFAGTTTTYIVVVAPH